MNDFERYRQSVILYTKVDLAVLAGVVTLATLLKLERSEVFSLLVQQSSTVQYLVGLLVFNVVLERLLLFLSGNRPMPMQLDRSASVLFPILLGLQTILHVGFFSYASGSVVGMAAAETEIYYRQEKQATEQIKKAIDAYYSSHAKFPRALLDLDFNADPALDNTLRSMHPLYNLVDSVSYLLTFPGPDGRFGNWDDRAHFVTYGK